MRATPEPEPVPVPVPETSKPRQANGSRTQPRTPDLEKRNMDTFDHNKLDVYRAAIEFLVLADVAADALPRGRAYLRDQLRRAALSISNNIAEGAGEFSVDEKQRFYRIAKRSATECAAILDACRALGLVHDDTLREGRLLLLRIVAMLVKLARGR